MEGSHWCRELTGCKKIDRKERLQDKKLQVDCRPESRVQV
jgi:hypothetical protein